MKRGRWIAIMLTAIIAVGIVLLVVFVSCGHVHEYEIVVTKEATCTEAGVRTLTCKDGDDTHTEEIPALGHSFQTVKQDATCTEDGFSKEVCSVCGMVQGETVLEKTGHTVVIDPAVDATETVSGLTEGSHCSSCGEVFVAQETIPAFGHDFDEGVVTKEPTCTEAGIRIRTCKHDATHQQTEVIPALGHIEVTDRGYAASCTGAGKTEGKHCSRCGAVLIAQRVVNPLGHAEVTDEAVAATCTGAGKTEGKHCSRCNTVLVAQTGIPALGHDYVNQICVRCGEEKGTEGLIYVRSGNGYVVTGYTGTEMNVVIPSDYELLPVTGIGERAFADRSDILSVKIPGTVTSIGAFAFSGCENLLYAVIPSGVTVIERYAFYECHHMESVALEGTVTAIEARAFSQCKALRNITGTGNLSRIGEYAFSGCKELSTIALTSSLTSVGAWAFSDSGLTEISVTGVTTIATGVFNGCYQLGNVELAYGTTSIGDYAFTGSGITEITIPKMVTSIGEWAFVSCIRLADVYYGGTQEEWETIEIKTGNDYLTNATIHYAQ